MGLGIMLFDRATTISTPVRSAMPVIVSSVSGSMKSSASRKYRYFPVAWSMPLLRATPAYWLDCVSNVTRASRSAMDATISRVSSVEPSSTTMTSMSFAVCLMTLVTHSATYSCALYAG